jgi:hypothetical protein
MKRKFIVRLTVEETIYLSEMVNKGRSAAFKIRHAHILLKANAEGSNWTDEKIADSYRCHHNTVANVRERFVEEGLDAALERKSQDHLSRARILDGDGEAKLIALGCSKPPEGQSRWTLRLLADQLVVLDIVNQISHETVRSTLKKRT